MPIDDIKKKFKGYFHDPVFKALIIEEGKGHEKVAEKIFSFIFPQTEDDEKFKDKEIEDSDHIASASDRLFLPKGKDYFNLSFKGEPQIIHPFSGEKKTLDLKDLIKYDRDDYQKSAVSLLSSINERGGDDNLFILLWELYGDILKKVFRAKNEVIDNLPADTRFPDHSIWEHLSTVSAIASALPKPSFLIFSISPVQSFITNSKKTRDFWLGSYILSYLTWKAIEKVISDFGPDSIVFPDLHKQPLFIKDFIEKILSEYEKDDNKKALNKVVEKLKSDIKDIDTSIPSIPNRFLAIIDYEKADSLLKEIENNVKEEIKKIGSYILNETFLNEDSIIDDEFKELFKSQLNNYFNLRAVVVPWRLSKDNPQDLNFDKVKERIKEVFGEDFFKEFFDFLSNIESEKRYDYNIGTIYTVLYDIAERFSASLKPLNLIENNPPQRYHKCTLCGEREALHLKDAFGWNDLSNLWKEISEKSNGLISEGEKLCGVCLTKRLFSFYIEDKSSIKERFPSTADIATIPYKVKLIEKIKENNEIKEKFRELHDEIMQIEPVREEGNLMVLYKKYQDEINRSDTIKNLINLNGELLYKETYNEKKGEIKFLNFDKEIAQNIEKLLSDMEEKVNSKPSHYYAVFKFDGDRMGKILKGALNREFKSLYHKNALTKIENEYPEFYALINDENIKRPLSPALHRLISRTLRNFSIEFVKEAIEKEGLGKVVYAGGDDVFAFLPLKNFFKSINLLRAFYSGEVEKNNGEWKVSYGAGNGWIEKNEDSFITLGKFATASLGASIVHWQEPLSLAIKMANEAEKEAKKSGRNAFSIKFKRRSGEIRSSVFNWYYILEDGKRYDFIGDFVEFFSKLFREDKLSPNFIQTLKLEFSNLWEDDYSKDKNDSEIKELFKEELLRTFKRSLIYKKEEGEELKSKEWKEKKVKELKEKLNNLLNSKNSNSELWDKISPFNSIKMFLHFLETIHFIEKGGDNV